MAASPRWATPRTPERKTLGLAAWKVSKILKQPLMAWQRDVLDVALELDERGHLVYRDVVLTTPRQSGKSTLVLSLIIARALVDARQHIVYCAQSALDARKQWDNNWVPVIERSLLGSQVRVRRAPGDESMWFPNGSRQSIAASTQKAAHGQVVDMAIVDEAFAYQDARLEQALRPAMMTRSRPGMLGAQLWIVSTAGTPTFSPYLWDKVERGRAAVDAGLTEGLCYFEWSASDNADPTDPATWRACMPALGNTVDEATVRAAQGSMARSEFARAYLNRWVTAMGDPIVPIEHWLGLAEPAAERPEWVVLGVDIGPKGSAASIVAAGEGPDGLQSTVLDSGQGLDWLLPALAGHVARYGSAEHGGPYVLLDERACAHLLPEIERIVGFDRVIARKTAEIPPACAFWLRLVQQGKLHHRGEPELTNALTGAGQRSLGDGWAWSRAKSGVDITPLVAQTLAVSFWMGSWGDVDG